MVEAHSKCPCRPPSTNAQHAPHVLTIETRNVVPFADFHGPPTPNTRRLVAFDKLFCSTCEEHSSSWRGLLVFRGSDACIHHVPFLSYLRYLVAVADPFRAPVPFLQQGDTHAANQRYKTPLLPLSAQTISGDSHLFFLSRGFVFCKHFFGGRLYSLAWCHSGGCFRRNSVRFFPPLLPTTVSNGLKHTRPFCSPTAISTELGYLRCLATHFRAWRMSSTCEFVIVYTVVTPNVWVPPPRLKVFFVENPM